MNIWKLVFVLVISPILRISAFNIELRKWNLNDYKANKSIEEVIKEYFEKRTRLLSVTLHLEYSGVWEFAINDYISDVFKRTESMKFEIFKSKKTKLYKKLPATYNLWYVDSSKAFGSLLASIDIQFVERMGYYMVVMEMATHLTKERELQLIFELAFRQNVVDIAVAIYAKKFTFNWYTYDVFQPQQCRQVVTRVFNVFREGVLESDELFPYKLHNFYKCPVDINILHSEPLFGYNLTSDRKQIDHYWGMEAKMVHTMAEKLNFELRLIHWGERVTSTVYENGTATGTFRGLMQNKMDMIMGYNLYPARSRYFAESSSYIMTPMVLVAPKRDEVVIEGMWLAEPYRKSAWLMIFLTISFGMAVVTGLRYGSKTYMTCLDMFALALGNSTATRYRFSCTKYSIIFWTFGFVIICSTFQGKLYGSFNIQPVPAATTVEQLIAANYTFLIKKFVGPELIKALQIPREQIEFIDSSDDNVVYAGMLNTSRPEAMLTNYWEFQAFLEAQQLHDEYDVVPRIVVMNQICAYMRPQAYLMEPLNRIVNFLNNGGILKKWMLDVAGRFRNEDEIESNRIEKTTEPIPLSLAKVRIVFFGLLALHALSFFVFLGEILVKKLSSKCK